MTESEIARKVEDIFVDLMKDETVPVRQRTKANCLRWDSLAQLGIISMLEQEFGVAITDDDAIDLNSFEAAVSIVKEKLSQKAA